MMIYLPLILGRHASVNEKSRVIDQSSYGARNEVMVKQKLVNDPLTIGNQSIRSLWYQIIPPHFLKPAGNTISVLFFSKYPSVQECTRNDSQCTQIICALRGRYLQAPSLYGTAIFEAGDPNCLLIVKTPLETLVKIFCAFV